jgi:trimethylamine--corrinoid protein Co-methyltransferase
MLESAVSMQAAVLCGANFILHSAGWLEGGLAMGYEKFVMDADFCGALHTYLRGMDLSADQFALDGFLELGPGKHFFSAQHTLRHYETAFWDSWVADNNSFEQWRDNGSKDIAVRANELWKRQLREYEAPPLDQALDEALQAFIARRKAVLPDSVA